MSCSVFLQALQKIIDTGRFLKGGRRRRAIVYLGGDLPWIKRLLGISTCPQVASPFNNAVRQPGEREYTGMGQARSVASDAANHQRYARGEASSLAVAGCISPPLLCIDRAFVVFCLLHATMALDLSVLQE